MDIRWLLRGDLNFLDFVPILESYPLDKLFMTDFMRSLTHEYWTLYQKKIIKRTLLPWLAYSIMSVFYFAEVLDPDYMEYSRNQKIFWFFYGVVLLLLAGNGLWVEVT